MKFLEKISFFYVLDKEIWKDKIEPNQYLATLSILLVALGGALYGAHDMIRGTNFSGFLNVSLIGTIGGCIILWGLNVTESIIASKSPVTSFLRSILLLCVFALSVALGYVASGIIMCIVAIVAGLVMISFFTTALVGTGKKHTIVNTRTGEKKEVTDMGINGLATSDGELISREDVKGL